MCIYICMYIYAQKNMNIHKHIYMYIFKHIYKHICKYMYINFARPHRRVFWRLADVGGERDFSLPTNMISLMGHCHGESCALYSKLRCGTWASTLLLSPFTYRGGATVSRVHARQLRTRKLSFFLWFWNPNSITEDPKDCPGPMPTVPGVAKMVRGPCLGAWIC